MKKLYISAGVLTLIMTFMEMTGLPAGLILNVTIADLNPIYITLMANFIIAWLICFLWRKTLGTDWKFGLRKEGIVSGLKMHSLPAIIAALVVLCIFLYSLAPFDNRPSAIRVVMEGFAYYIGVGIMEELYLRGLLQNLCMKLFHKSKNEALYAILTTSILFGMGHIFGALNQPVLTIVLKALWAIGLGIYFGCVYYVTGNLWVPIILHTIIDFAGVPYCFTTSISYPTIALLVSFVSFGLLGVYGLMILYKKKGNMNKVNSQNENN